MPKTVDAKTWTPPGWQCSTSPAPTAADARRMELTQEIAAARARAQKVVSRLEPLLYELAEMITREAGLDRRCLGQHIHNSQVGKPWPGVDYRLVRLADLVLHHIVYLPEQLTNVMFDLQCLADPTYPQFTLDCIRRNVEEGKGLFWHAAQKWRAEQEKE